MAEGRARRPPPAEGRPYGPETTMTKVPGKAKAGTATVTSKGSSGSASATFTVPSP
jgi:hypothetical protein